MGTPNSEEWRTLVQSLLALEGTARRVPEHMSMARAYLRGGNAEGAAATLREAAGVLMRLAEMAQREADAVSRWTTTAHSEPTEGAE